MARRHPEQRMANQTYRIPDGVAAKIMAEAKRQERSPSWIVRQALELGLPVVCTFPTAGETARSQARDLMRQEGEEATE